MSKLLAKSAAAVQSILEQEGIVSRVLELTESARTAKDAANAIGCGVNQIVKSLIFKTKNTHRPVLLLVSGSNQADEKAIEKHLSEEIMKADADYTREVTGFAIGGIPPIGHAQKIELVFIDEDLVKLDSLWAAAGTPHAVFNLTSQDLVNLTSGKVVSMR